MKYVFILLLKNDFFCANKKLDKTLKRKKEICDNMAKSLSGCLVFSEIFRIFENSFDYSEK